LKELIIHMEKENLKIKTLTNKKFIKLEIADYEKVETDNNGVIADNEIISKKQHHDEINNIISEIEGLIEENSEMIFEKLNQTSGIKEDLYYEKIEPYFTKLKMELKGLKK